MLWRQTMQSQESPCSLSMPHAPATKFTERGRHQYQALLLMSTLNFHSPISSQKRLPSKSRSLTILEILSCVIQKNDSPLIAVGCFVENVDSQIRQLRGWLLKHLAQILDSHFKIFLVLFEDLGEVVSLQVICKRVCPFQGLAAKLEGM